MRILKIIGDIDININLPEDTEVFESKLSDYMVTEYEEKFDMIFCIHALQTLWADQVGDAIQKLVKDLKDRGELHIHVPATEQAMKTLLKNENDPTLFYMIWGSKENPFHVGFNLVFLRALVEESGALIRQATIGLFSMKRGDEEVKAVEHIIVATVDRS